MTNPDASVFKDGSDLNPDTLAQTLGTFPCPSPGYAVFVGYLSPELGAGPGDPHADPPVLATCGVHRLYLDNTMWSYMEICHDDIVQQFSVPLDAGDARSTVWVKRNAVVTKCRSDEAHCFNEEDYGDPGGGPNRPPGRP
jgi:hypothetical protein